MRKKGNGVGSWLRYTDAKLKEWIWWAYKLICKNCIGWNKEI